ncbi:hypothetical protein [Amycolatopsis vastitatis]|uniref:Uncharacterized protein n=1 Tax=Amycolatopsis vastitatis TaxID=1905142 RepID=A0A229SVB5_9PSEU|nr:hypothetical protein [Amycolatopsis vastitatis]OXM62700.1 hypothetical protein CF165_33490 [Amycolatopsis vastitatis]
MIVLVLWLAGGGALVITGIVQDQPVTAILGGALLAFLLWGLVSGGSGDDDDCGEA